MAREPVYEGRKLTIRCVEYQDGSCPADDFIRSLSDSESASLQPTFEKLGDEGVLHNKERFKKIEGSEGIFEVKHHQVRILGFFTPRKEFILVDGTKKKKHKHKKADITKAENVRAAYFKALERRK
ncbi:MAG: type II toxin-antitoxin system RelE/ParE family toxin [Gemmatimonadota bacterium]